jgi:hypothetical protein
MAFTIDLSPFFSSFPTVSMTVKKDTAYEQTVTVLDGKLTANASANMVGIATDYGYTPGKSKTVIAKATELAAPTVGELAYIAGEAWRILSVQSDQAGISHKIELGDEFAQ